jgi:hypothetical protein
VWSQDHVLHQLAPQARLADRTGPAVALRNRPREQEELHTDSRGNMESVHGFRYMVLLGSGHSRLAVEDRHYVHLEVVTGKGSVTVEGIGPIEPLEPYANKQSEECKRKRAPVAEDRGYLHIARGCHKGVVLGALRADCIGRIPRTLAAGEVGYSYHRNTLVQTC